MYRLTIRPAVSQSTFEVKLCCGDETVSATARASRAVSEDALVIGVLGQESEKLIQALHAVERQNIHGQREVVEAIRLYAESFAQNEREMSAFDAVVVLDGEDGALDRTGAEALESWRQAGGILVRRSSGDLHMPERRAPEHGDTRAVGHGHCASENRFLV